MAADFGWKITDARERAVLLAYQQCIGQDADRFIIEQTGDLGELEQALHLLLSDVWNPATYRLRRVIKSGIFLRFEEISRSGAGEIVGEWIGNRSHGVVYVDAIRELRARARRAAP